ncbi:PAS domain S-box protein [Palleronia sp. THAF1]|uniref:PAS domain S-box protein n=1 Tax=Palleronia sp. THAF1 TaxID=2587842 RepID=UPI001562E5DD|nr:PAS domain S-box protein [Palleronia sp. THAF1]
MIDLDGAGRVLTMNGQMKAWLGLDDDQPGLTLHDLLPRAVRIYFETHLRPLLIVEGKLSEVSVDFLCSDGTRLGTYLNAVADRLDGKLTRIRMAVFRNETRKAFEQELIARRRESDLFKVLVASSPQAIVSIDDGQMIRSWNPAATRLFGYDAESVIGQPIRSILLSSEMHAPFEAALARATAGEIVRDETVRIHQNGHPVDVEVSIAVVHDEIGKVSGFMLTFIDISHRKAAEAEASNLLEELNHRSKNILSIVQVIARQTGRFHDGPEFHNVLSQRLASLISNQESLIHKQGRTADLGHLAKTQFSHLIDPKGDIVTLEGPPVQLNQQAAQAIGMAIFELVTNAVKYGSLSQPDGRVLLTWTVVEEDEPGLKMTWQEEGGPAIAAPARRGFGSQVTGPILEGVTHGQTTRDYVASGFVWTFSAPLDRLC